MSIELHPRRRLEVWSRRLDLSPEEGDQGGEEVHRGVRQHPDLHGVRREDQGCNSTHMSGTSPNLSQFMLGILRHVLTCTSLIHKAWQKGLRERTRAGTVLLVQKKIAKKKTIIQYI